MSAVPTLPIADPAAASAGPAKSRASRLQISPRSRDGMRVFMGYHGIIWGSMGMDSKTLEYPGVAEVFTSPWGVFGTKRDRIACPARANAMLTRQWGEMMFFFCSHHREDRAELGRGKSARRPISRVLSRPLAGPWMTIPLGRPLPDASRDLPGRRRQKPAWPAPAPKDRPAGRPYAVLLPVGFTMPLPSPAARCALTAPFHPYRRPRLAAGAGGLLSVALSLGSPPPGVTRHRVSVEPGLSSPRPRKVEERPSSRLAAVS